MEEVDERVFQFITILKQVGTITFDLDFANAIDLKKQNLNNIKHKRTHFTVKHIDKIRKVYNGNPNWFFGIEKNMYITPKLNK